MNFARTFLNAALLALICCSVAASGAAPKTWHFAVSGDSRNCGDIVMPTIAKDLSRTRSEFYWHLGDLRAIANFDEDITNRAGAKPLSIYQYEATAWQDMIQNQIDAFKVPFFLGIGNHETTTPKSRNDFLLQFADWLTTPVLQAQRLKDAPGDHKLRAYFHWQQDGVDFIYLDNASSDMFDAAQMAWFRRVIAADEADAKITSIVVGMHEALPDSISSNHSMSNYPTGVQTGRTVYARLLQARARKNVYVIASHSHFFMDGIFDSDYWRANGGVLPGWIVGTAGAVRYPLPPLASRSKSAKTNVYGYLLGTVNPPGAPGTIQFDFQERKENNVPADVSTKFGADLTHWCFEHNTEAP